MATTRHMHRSGPGRPVSETEEVLALSRLEPEQSCAHVGSGLVGLTAEEAARRQQIYGPNRITRESRPTILRELWGRAKNPLNALLLTLTTTSYVLGDVRAAVVIAVMVLLAVATAFVQEHRSNEAAARLRSMVRTTAAVKRSTGDAAGAFSEVPIETLVPGDIVRLSAGDMIPADLRLLETRDLFINQSALTGEAMPAEKFAHACTAQVEGPFDLPNMCFMGANVVSGYATGVVVRTGRQAFFGQLAHELAGRRLPTAFEKGIDRFT